MRSGSICALLWRILIWCSRKRVTQAQHFPGRLNVVADKRSRLGQTIQRSGLFFQRSSIIMQQVATTLIDLFATGFNKLPLCHQYQTPWPWQWMDSACHGRVWMHMPSHQQSSWASDDEAAGLPMQENHNCSRVAQHALVLGPSGHVHQIPICPTCLHSPSIRLLTGI